MPYSLCALRVRGVVISDTAFEGLTTGGTDAAAGHDLQRRARLLPRRRLEGPDGGRSIPATRVAQGAMLGGSTRNAVPPTAQRGEKN